jgi:hypothetical protein
MSKSVRKSPNPKVVRAQVRYERFPEIGLGFIPVIEETLPGEVVHPDDRDAPRPEHYREAARLEAEYRAKNGGAR